MEAGSGKGGAEGVSGRSDELAMRGAGALPGVARAVGHVPAMAGRGLGAAQAEVGLPGEVRRREGR
ncbi:hypothetical protein [Kitasatospora sp. Root107]|uniref:hypothetical protein n=1 Tax=Kitasatospora sp. Root107 TaxID=1736424 RepID=UPI000B01C969|nr:hypothetical protein [Kitasatospora sp. Root107]